MCNGIKKSKKKAKVLTEEQITTFFMEAADEVFILEKVILLFGIYGACRREELVKLSVDDIEDSGKFIVVTLQDTKNKSSRRFTITDDGTPFKGCELYRKYAALRPSDLQARRFFVDFRKGKCTRQFVGVHKIGGVPRKIADSWKALKILQDIHFAGRVLLCWQITVVTSSH
jgi:site-specific recombinase XerD